MRDVTSFGAVSLALELFLGRAVTARRNDEVLAARAPLSLRFYRPLTRSSKQKQTAPRFRPASSLGRHPSHVAAESRARGRRGTCHTVSQPAQLRPFPGPAAPCELERGPGRWWRSPRPAASDLKLVTNRPSFGLLGWVNLSAPDSDSHFRTQSGRSAAQVTRAGGRPGGSPRMASMPMCVGRVAAPSGDSATL